MDLVQALAIHRQNRCEGSRREIDPLLSIDWSDARAAPQVLVGRGQSELADADVKLSS